MNNLHTVLALLLLVDFGLWAGGSVSLWQAAIKTAHLKSVLEEVAPGEEHPEATLPMFARAASHQGDAASVCAMPTKKWALVPVLGPLMIARQHHIYAQCLQDKISNITVLKKRRSSKFRGVLYIMVLMVTLANVKLPIGIPGARITSLLLGAMGQ